jgi:N-succinyldiaminopimelate aminotransferase
MEDLSVREYPGMHRYTSPHGLPALLEAVVERVRERTAVPTEPGEVLITAGATGGLGAVMGAIVEPGDEVLITAPYWPLIEGIVRSFHGTPVAVPFHAEAAIGSADAAAAALEARRTSRTVAVYWNTPHNPSGAVIPARWLEEMSEWARRHGLWVLADEVYEECQFEGAHAYTRPLAPERTFSCHSFSKAYGMAGNRCGYVVGPAAAMSALRKVSTHTFYATPTAAQIAAVRALAGPGDRWARAAREQYAATGRDAARRLGVDPPRGSAFLFLDLTRYLDESAGGLGAFLERCADQGLLLAPGPSFGPYPRAARLCYTAAPPDLTRRGVEKLAALLGR